VEVSELGLENVPLEAVQVALVALPPMLPAKVTVPPAQTVWGDPAFEIAAWSTVITTVEEAAVHGPVPSGSFVVNVRVTDPLEMLGVYVDVNKLAFEKVPLGADHVALVALPPMFPASVTVPPAHTVCDTPAFAVAARFTMMLAVLLRLIALPQEPDARFVIVIVVTPLFGKEVVVNVPVPAITTFIVAVFPVKALGAL